MMTEAWRNYNVSTASSAPRNSPPKRSFDVAFLTGIKENAISKDDVSRENSRSHIKIPKTNDLNPFVKSPSPPSGDSVLNSFMNGEGNNSAFTKVLKSQVFPISSSPYSEAFGSSFRANSWSPSSFNAMNSFLSNKGLSPLIGNSSFLPLVPLLSPSAATSISSDRFNNNLVEEYLKSRQELLIASKTSLRRDISPSEAISRLRNSMLSSADTYKLPYSYGLSPANGASSSSSSSSKISPGGFIPPSSGGAVSALIPPSMTPLSLPAQNVCAKCNISFRMTSDLVYHMRSQHKREQDLFKKRRNEKLKCTICGESFRERHHLTRHMSAHKDRDEEAPNSADEK